MPTIEVVEADLATPAHAAALIGLLDAYAQDPMGGGRPLSQFVRANLARELQQRPGGTVLLAYAGAAPVGLTICMAGFSTFACQPLLNVHDIVVLPGHRCQGIARRMLERAEQIARRQGCCKLTLEVLEGNRGAQTVYSAAGFAPYQLDPQAGRALFWQKVLEPQTA